MLKIGNLSPFVRDLALTTGTSIATGCCVVLATRLLAQGLGPEGFGVYSLSRRVLGTVAAFSTLSMGVTIARHIAISLDPTCRFRFLLSGLILGVAPSLAIALLGLVFFGPLSSIIFHNAGYSTVVVAILFMLVGCSFYDVLYAFYRGTGQMEKANLWQLAVFAIGPLVIASVYATTRRVDWILFLMGTLCLASVVPLAIYLSKGVLSCRQPLRIGGPIKELFRYGFPRTSAGLALSGIWTIGPLLAPYFGLMKDAGYLVAGQSVFGLADVGISAFGIIALPKAAQLLSEGRVEFLRERIQDITVLTIQLGLFGAAHLLLWSDQVILVWLGHQFVDAIPLMRILILALVPYLFYVTLRSFIDAVEVRPVNTFNLGIGLIVTVVASLFLARLGYGSIGLAVGTTLGLITLGLMTVRYLWRASLVTAKGFRVKECLWLNAVAFAIAFCLKVAIVHSFTPTTAFIFAVLLEGVLIVAYLLSLRKLGVRWTKELEQRVVTGGRLA